MSTLDIAIIFGIGFIVGANVGAILAWFLPQIVQEPTKTSIKSTT